MPHPPTREKDKIDWGTKRVCVLICSILYTHYRGLGRPAHVTGGVFTQRREDGMHLALADGPGAFKEGFFHGIPALS